VPLTLQIITPERVVFSVGGVESVTLPGAEGELTVLPSHAPLMTALKPGPVVVRRGGEDMDVALSGGFLEVRDDRVVVLADAAERSDEIDAARAEAARERARAALAAREGEIDLARNRTLRTINDVVQSAQAYSEQLNKRKSAIEAKKKVEFPDKPAPPALERELENIDAELARQVDLIALKKRETAAINARYDTDKQRWRELIAAKGGEPAVAARAAIEGGAPPAGDAGPYPGVTPKK